MRKLKAVAAILMALTMSACVDDDAVEPVIEVSKNVKTDAHDFKVSDKGVIQFDAEIVYFKFDDHTLTQEGRERLASLAKYLKKHPDKRLQISGHCDERGSIEYNLALGDMRAKSVRQYLANLGLSPKRIHSVSYGEEQPAAEGHSEKAWAQNRRAEFVLTSLSE